MQIGNSDISVEQVVLLGEFFEVRNNEDEDTLYLRPRRESYSPEEVKVIIQTIGSLCPDECDFEGEYVRFWWD